MENRKPLLIALGGLGAVLLVTAALAALFSGVVGTRHRGDPDAPYPYEWRERGDGRILLSLNARGEKEGVWSCPGTEGVVTVDLGQTRGGKARAELTPTVQGREEVSFLLLAGEDPAARLTLTVETLEKAGKITSTVTAHAEAALQRPVTGGEKTGFPYTVYTDENGVLRIRLQDPAWLERYANDDAELSSAPGTAGDQAAYEAGELETAPEDPDPLEFQDTGGGEETEEADPVPWTARSADALVAEPGAAAPGPEGIEFPVYTSMDGTAEVTLSGTMAGFRYIFELRSRGGALLLTGERTEAYAPARPEDTARERLETALSPEKGLPESEDLGPMTPGDPAEVNFREDPETMAAQEAAAGSTTAPSPVPETGEDEEPETPDTEEEMQTELEPDQPETWEGTYEEYLASMGQSE